MRIRQTTHALGQRIATLEEALESDGSVMRPTPPSEPPEATWYVDLRVEAPGSGLPQAAAYRYQEWWQPSRGAWELTAYVYDYRYGPSISGIFGFHWHEMLAVDPSGAPVYHVKCQSPVRSDIEAHFRGWRMDIWEAREEFAGIDASGDWPTCRGLRSLP